MTEGSDDRPMPDEPVWNHMESGAQMARDDLANQLGENDFRFYMALSDQVLALRINVLVSEPTTEIPSFLTDSLPQLSPELWRSVIKQLPQSADKWSPYLRYAVEIQVAEKALGRMYPALDRFSRLQPLLVAGTIPPRVLPYLRELVDSYLFGFDVSCIALSCACLEQVGKHALVATGKMTERQLDKEKLTAEGVVSRLSQHDLISSSLDAAKRLVERRNRVLHRSVFEDAVLPTLALDSIAELLQACRELAPSWPPAA